MENPITVVIPTKYYIDMIIGLIPSLSDADKVYIYDNGLPNDLKAKLIYKIPPKWEIIEAYNKSIYQIWNEGWTKSQEDFINPHIAILNDDVYFLPGTLTLLSKALQDNKEIGAICPDYWRAIDAGIVEPEVKLTTSTYGRGGLSGFAFMLNGSLKIDKIDEFYNWWYGDDELVLNIEKAGFKVAKLLGVPLVHSFSRSSRLDATIAKSIEKDRTYFNNKHNEARQ